MSKKNEQIRLSAVRLGMALEERTEAMRLAVGEAETIKTSTDLSLAVLENMDFIIYCVKKVGGLTVDQPEPLAPNKPGLIKLSPALTGIPDNDPDSAN